MVGSNENIAISAQLGLQAGALAEVGNRMRMKVRVLIRSQKVELASLASTSCVSGTRRFIARETDCSSNFCKLADLDRLVIFAREIFAAECSALCTVSSAQCTGHSAHH